MSKADLNAIMQLSGCMCTRDSLGHRTRMGVHPHHRQRLSSVQSPGHRKQQQGSKCHGSSTQHRLILADFFLLLLCRARNVVPLSNQLLH